VTIGCRTVGLSSCRGMNMRGSGKTAEARI
jgi:hypothetical protein